MTALISAPTSVYKAAKILDSKVKGWYKRINLDLLSMGSISHCILAQLFNGDCYSQNIFDETMPDGSSMWITSAFSAGMDLNKPHRERKNHVGWIRQIQKRLARNEKLRQQRAAAKVQKPQAVPVSDWPEQIIVTLDPSVYENAGAYSSVTSCPIATALKKQFPSFFFNVGPHTVFVHKDSITLGNTRVATYEIFGDCGSARYIENAREKKLTVPVILNKAGR